MAKKFLDLDGLQLYNENLHTERYESNKVVAAALNDLNSRIIELVQNGISTSLTFREEN